MDNKRNNILTCDVKIEDNKHIGITISRKEFFKNQIALKQMK